MYTNREPHIDSQAPPFPLIPMASRNATGSARVLKEHPLLEQLDALIKLRGVAAPDSLQKPADDTKDWLVVNFLFSIPCQDVGVEALSQLNTIVRRWTSPDPLSFRDFSSMLRILRDLIAQGA